MGVQPETYLQRNIQKLIVKRGGYAVKQHGSMLAEPGIPDILACYKGFFLAIEAKDGNNKPSKQQGIHIRNIQKSNGITIVTWDIDSVEKLLDIIDSIVVEPVCFQTDITKANTPRQTHYVLYKLRKENIDTGEKW